MIPSILNSAKKILGMDASYTVFDDELIIFINSTLSNLHRLGVGPEEGFAIQDATATWEDLIGTDPVLNMVQTYVSLSVKLMFDPPPTSYSITAMQNQVDKQEWLITQYMEETNWVDPRPADLPEEDLVLDGGQP